MARHVPTPEQRANVTVLTGLGASVEMIAGLLNVEPDTVKTAYAKELAQGPDAVRLEAMRQLFNAAKTAEGAGRVTAAVKLLDMLGGGEQAAVDANTIRIRRPAEDYSHTRTIYVPSKHQWWDLNVALPELYDREGRLVCFFAMYPGDERP